MSEINELERCRTCGAYTGPERMFCPSGAMHYGTGAPLDEVSSFCEKAYKGRVEAGLPTVQFRPWAEVHEERERARQSGPDGTGGTCGLPECGRSVDPPKVYCSEAHRARAYRLRRRGELR